MSHPWQYVNHKQPDVNHCLFVGLQMTDLLADGEGLSWIVSQDATKLLLIPGLQPASIGAAAAGDQQALAYLRFTARHHAAYPGVCALNPLDKACLEASQVDSSEGYGQFITALREQQPRVAAVFDARENHTIDQLYKAARVGQLAALQWRQAFCPQTWCTDSNQLITDAAAAGHISVLKHLRSRADPDDWDDDVSSAAVSDWIASNG